MARIVSPRIGHLGNGNIAQMANPAPGLTAGWAWSEDGTVEFHQAAMS